MGAENTTTGPKPSFRLISFMRFMILGMPLPSVSRRLPPNFAIESALMPIPPYMVLADRI